VTSACGLTCVELTYAADLRLAKAGIDIGVEFLKVENATIGNSDIEACDAAMRRCGDAFVSSQCASGLQL